MPPDRLEQRLRRFAVPRLTLLLALGQLVTLALTFNPEWDCVRAIGLTPGAVTADGEWWRLASFLLIPPFCLHPLLALFSLYLFLLMGNALEEQWGTVRYNLFLLTGWAGTVAAAFLTPDAPATNGYITGSVFLAFAILYPDFEIALFFLLPVRIKYLALVTWILYGAGFVFGGWGTRFLILAAVANVLIFFRHAILLRISRGRRRMSEQARSLSQKGQTLHRCTQCGATEKSHPGAEFRYCTQCEPAGCFCTEHFQGHAHLRKKPEA